MTKDKDRTPVAQNVITVCPKCEMELNHVVVAHNAAGIVERVKCHTCGGEHKYRPDKKRATKKTSVNQISTKEVDSKETFERLAQKFREKKPLPYRMSGSFKNDDVIDHGTFGMGIVISASHDKMEVAFSDRPRILVCNREAAVST
jgi:DNA-directed RNA polymerase subunit M/transcription elongation factor TFIIS